VLYLIWKNPWMTVSRDTYVSRMLALVKWETVPADCADRYPKIELNSEVLDGARVVLLSSEPYLFARRMSPSCAPNHFMRRRTLLSSTER